MLSLSLFSVSDLAKPANPSATRLSAAPYIWLTHDFVPSSTVDHMLSKVPKDESAYSPCIGQVEEFDSKKCTMLATKDDPIMEAVISKVESTWGVDGKRLRADGLPIIRYLPGAPPVGKHGDEDRHGTVPNATLVMYLTASSGAAGQTMFPDADIAVTPRAGSILSFQNVDGEGAPHPKAKHWVSAVPKDAPRDRIVVQIPIATPTNGEAPYAYAEHVSGAKKPGQHEKMHGNPDQKGAYQAAVAAGMSIAVAYMAAKAGKFEAGDEAALKTAAEETGKFDDADFVAGSAK
jgi:hypothetical protein